VPHGMAVALHAPAVFRFTGPANPELHLYAAGLLGADTSGVPPENAGEVLAKAIADLMRRVGMPNGLAAVGFGPADVGKLVAATLPQHRVTKLSPRPVDAEALTQLFLNSLTCW
jgi:hydroxyacid-oxoacid transhydrogenase